MVDLGHQLPFWSAIPFAGTLLSIALLPLFAPHWWEKHMEKICIFWICLFTLPFFFAYGGELTLYKLLHALVVEYIPFVVLIFALFTITGGIVIRGNLKGKPMVNTGILVVASILASWVGTTGAAMIFIRPLMRALEDRKNKSHTVIFFIFMVCNVGGALTPIGDPPLFLGFIHGVPFFWTMQLLPLMGISLLILTGVYFALDTYFYRQEQRESAEVPQAETSPVSSMQVPAAAAESVGVLAVEAEGSFSEAGSEAPSEPELSLLPEQGKAAKSAIKADSPSIKPDPGKAKKTLPEKRSIQVLGLRNLIFLAGVIGAVILSGVLNQGPLGINAATGETLGLHIMHLDGHDLIWSWVDLGRDVFILLMAWCALKFTPYGLYKLNMFSWAPIREVAVLFVCIFITMIPAMDILQARGGELGLTAPIQFFWATGILSSFLDNAPTYLTFLSLAGSLGATAGVYTDLGYVAPEILLAISCGAVFMGALTYVGNAPNFMVRSIAQENKIKMPSFFGYMGWSIGILVPIFILLTFIFFL